MSKKVTTATSEAAPIHGNQPDSAPAAKPARKPRQSKSTGPQMMLIRKIGSDTVLGVVNGPSSDAGIKAVVGEYTAEVVGIGIGFKTAADNGLVLIDLYAGPQPDSAE
jgi:hypothetical protein